MVPFEPFKGVYNSFELQRSDDGKTYKTIKDKSYYSLSTTPDDPKYNIYNDSVAAQAAIVYYRLRGRTSFDSYGPYSDTLEVKVMPSLSGEPWITDIKEVGTGKLIVTWETPEYKPENKAENKKEAYSLIITSRRDNADDESFRRLRIFPKLPGVEFKGKVHEDMCESLNNLGVNVKPIDVEIIHKGYRNDNETSRNY